MQGFGMTETSPACIFLDPADAERKIGLLTSENEALTGKISRLEERVAVLERIATDKSSRLSEEIENLR